MKIFLLLLALLVCVFAESRGFNDKIEWRQDFEQAQADALKEGKPIMLLVHKSWCGACKRLKTIFQSKEIETRSHKFISVNLEDDEHSVLGPEYSPDGGYIPRLFFIAANGSIMTDIVGPNAQYKHFFASEFDIVKSMDIALERAVTDVLMEEAPETLEE